MDTLQVTVAAVDIDIDLRPESFNNEHTEVLWVQLSLAILKPSVELFSRRSLSLAMLAITPMPRVAQIKVHL